MDDKGALAAWLEGKWLQWQAEHKRRMSQRLFAEWLGVPSGTLTNWISGSRRKLDEESIELLAEKLGPEIYDVLDIPRPDPRLQFIIRNWANVPLEVQEAFTKEVQRVAERRASQDSHKPVEPAKRK